MGVLNKFTGKLGERYDWDRQRYRKYGDEPGASKGASVRWLIGKDEAAPNYALRYFELEPGGHSRREQHEHDHGVIVVCGRARVEMGAEVVEAAPLDVVYIPGGEWHQLVNIGEDTFGFFCIIPARRIKDGLEIYAEG